MKQNNLKEIRLAKNMSISCLARKIEITERHLRFIEDGTKNPSLHVAQKIATELDTSIEKIFWP